ncbi:MAG: hypothetical protein ABIA66_01720, partial [Candidatus Omnitrophota bacterium]
LASKEGIFVEPASAASVAGLLKLAHKGYFSHKVTLPAGRQARSPGHRLRIVCILTGHGLKDPDRAIESVKKPKIVKANLNSVLREIGY